MRRLWWRAAGRLARRPYAIGNQRVTLPHTVTERLERGPHDLTVGVRPEAFVAEHDGANALFAVPDPATVEVLGSETLVRATLGSDAVTVRLIGAVRDLPKRVAAPPEALHLFSAESGQRLGSPSAMTRVAGGRSPIQLDSRGRN